MFVRAEGFSPVELVGAGRDHMRAAKRLFDSDDPFLFDSAGYLAHLSIELVLKALLLDLTGRFPAQHDLEKLSRLLAEELPGFGFSDAGQRILVTLNAFGELRYPSPRDPVEIGSDDVELILELWSAMWEALPEELRPKREPQGVVTKGGRVLMRKRIKTPPNRALEPTASSK